MRLLALKILLLIFLLSPLTGSAASFAPDKPKILIVAKEFTSYSSSIAKAIDMSSLEESHQIINLRLEDWQADIEASLIITLGSEPLEKLSSNEIKAPILATLITSHQWLQYQTKLANDKPLTNKVSAIFYDPDPVRQLALAKQILPAASSIGIIHSESYHSNTQNQKYFAEKLALKLNAIINQKRSKLFRQYAQLSSQNDLVLLIPDRTIVNQSTLPKMLLTSYRQNTLVIGYSNGTVKSGAVATTMTSQEQLLKDIIETSNELLLGAKSYGARYSRYYSVTSNPEVAKSLGVRIEPNKQLKKNLERALAKIKYPQKV